MVVNSSDFAAYLEYGIAYSARRDRRTGAASRSVHRRPSDRYAADAVGEVECVRQRGAVEAQERNRLLKWTQRKGDAVGEHLQEGIEDEVERIGALRRGRGEATGSLGSGRINLQRIVGLVVGVGEIDIEGQRAVEGARV